MAETAQEGEVMPGTLRDYCIAYEACLETIKLVALNSAGEDVDVTFQQIADEVIGNVQSAADNGLLGVLYGSWTRDPEEF